MLRYKALQIIKTFTSEDVKKFELFLDSPYFNTSKKVAQLYSVITKFHPDFDSQRLTNTYLKKKLNTTSESTLKNLFADLYPLTENFLRINRMENHSYINEFFLLSELNDRNIKKLFDVKYKHILKISQETRKISSDYFYYMHSFLNQSIIDKNKQGTLLNNTSLFKIINLQTDSSNHIFTYFILDTLKILINMVSHANSLAFDTSSNPFLKIFNEYFPDDKLDKIVRYLIKQEKNENAKELLQLYFLNYKFRTSTDNEAILYFKEFKRLIEKSALSLDLEEKFDLFLENRWLFLFVLRNPEYENLEFKFYDTYLKYKGYQSAGKEHLNLPEFKHLITRGDDTNRFEWSDDLIRNYSGNLPLEMRKTIIHLRNAKIALKRDHEPQKSLDELSKIKTFFQYDVKRDMYHFSIASNYELGNYEEVRYKCDAFKHFLKNQKIGKPYSIPFQKFVNFVLLLSKYKENKTKPFKNLVAEIENSGIIATKLWLVDKAKELL